MWTDPQFIGADIRVAGIHYDGFFTESDTLTEVKTGGFYGTIKSLPNITPARQRFLDFLLAKSILDYYRERIPSAVCGYDVREAVLVSVGDAVDAYSGQFTPEPSGGRCTMFNRSAPMASWHSPDSNKTLMTRRRSLRCSIRCRSCGLRSTALPLLIPHNPRCWVG